MALRRSGLYVPTWLMAAICAAALLALFLSLRTAIGLRGETAAQAAVVSA